MSDPIPVPPAARRGRSEELAVLVLNRTTDLRDVTFDVSEWASEDDYGWGVAAQHTPKGGGRAGGIVVFTHDKAEAEAVLAKIRQLAGGIGPGPQEEQDGDLQQVRRGQADGAALSEMRRVEESELGGVRPRPVAARSVDGEETGEES